MAKQDFNKKDFILIQSAGRGYDENYSYENYLEFCKENEIEPAEKNSQRFYNWQSDEAEIDFDCFFGNLKYAKAENGFYMITYSLGLWNTNIKGYIEKIFDSLSEAIKFALESSRDYWDYEVKFENGEVVVYGYHHDGCNVLTISQLSKHGQRNLLDKDEPNYEKYVQMKDTFKKLNWQFAWI